jgi:hypothetical protein
MLKTFTMKALIRFFCLLVFITGCGGNINVDNAASPTITWDAPTTHVDGSLLADLAGYKIYCGTTSGSNSYSEVARLPLEDVSCSSSGASRTFCTYTMQGVLAGTYYCAVTAYTTDGYESEFSNEVVKTF